MRKQTVCSPSRCCVQTGTSHCCCATAGSADAASARQLQQTPPPHADRVNSAGTRVHHGKSNINLSNAAATPWRALVHVLHFCFMRPSSFRACRPVLGSRILHFPSWAVAPSHLKAGPFCLSFPFFWDASKKTVKEIKKIKKTIDHPFVHFLSVMPRAL